MNTGNENYFISQEELLSEIEIQDRMIKSFEKAVYENIGQVLSLAKMQLFAINQEKLGDLHLKIAHSRKLISRAIHDLRQITKQMGPNDIIRQGVAFAIEYELDRIKYSGDCETGFSLNGPFFKLDDKKELLLFNILQELVTDVLMMQVSKLTIQFLYAAEDLEISIIHHNKNAGFSTDKLLTQNKKIINRLKLIKAGWMITSGDDNGLIVITVKK